ncbi:MAG: helix-turn-helix domain-containing protein [Candidatus Cloacimonetes bacterium]|nr:helix-turn-helix domain-containing protein [Candidatus Cloacimonadota bacterium]
MSERKLTMDDVMMGQRIARVRKELGKTMATLSDELDIEKSSLSRYERNLNKPSADFLRGLLRSYSVNANWLLDGQQEMFIRSDDEVAPVQVFEMPIAGEIAAGPAVAVEQYPVGTIQAPAPMVENNPDKFFVFRVNGRSMQPEIGHQDMVFIRRNDNWRQMNSKIVAVRIEGEITLKRLQLDDDKGLIILQPFNPEYKTIVVNPEDLSDISMIGELKTIIRKYRN